VIARRKEWKAAQGGLDIGRLVFLDECGINTGMTRLYGWGPRSERVADYVPDARFERTSVISALRLSGVCAAVAFRGALDGDLFKAYVEQALAPALREGDIVVMDNLSSHKARGALRPIYGKGASVLFLPQYSPDLNPIELAWSKIKSVLRKLKAKGHEELLAALSAALGAISQSDIRHWFAHGGYFYTKNTTT
jgi:transposase